MLSSIHPLGERAKGNRFSITAAFFVGGSVLGGAVLGLVVGALAVAVASLLAPEVRLAIALVAAAFGAVAEWRGIPLPCLHRQVDDSWLTRYRRWVYAGGFGVQLGAGVTTYVTTAAIAVMIVAMAMSGSFVAAVAIGALFGLVRGASILTGARITSPERLVRFHRSLQAGAPRVRATSSVTLAAAACAMLAVTTIGA